MNLPVGHYLQNKKYQLLQVVGQGGFGITYKGILFTEVKGALGTIKTDIPISIKEYFFKDYCYRASNGVNIDVHSETGQLLFQKFKEKLIKEAKILSEVHHPHIVHVLDVFEENNTAYIAMEYISGHSLKYILERGGILPEAKVLKYIHQTGEALRFVHEKNILHLDIKPSNILIDKSDNARLIDFGVSKRYDVENTETSTTMLTLSKGFASIEQYDNEGTHLFSPCPDIYSLGATMYNLLTGRIPTESILRATRVFSNPSELNPAVTSNTESVILKAMQVNPADRFQTVTEMLAALAPPPVEEKQPKPSPGLQLPEDYEDETIAYSPFQPHPPKEGNKQAPAGKPPVSGINNKKKRRKDVLIIFLICIFAAVGASVAILVGKGNGAVPASVEFPPETLTENNPVDGEPVKDIAKENSNTEEQPRENLAGTNPQENRLPAVKPEVEDTIVEQAPVDQPAVDQPAMEEMEAGYMELIASGKEKMNAGNYIEADEDFYKAISLKATSEVKQLLISNAAKIEEKRIAERLALYEEKTTFGKYKIVRKKLTGKYGAIDDKGEERIPCKYVYVGIAGENRAFQRDDNLFDIYNTNGVLIKSDVTY
ncbi:MAG: serine/threonine protein kinase [Tannerellaceae bacterium]|jgi:serine/threonine-protein kinase|nr:serine/threonine protein kinase [Tannerellaceae bacterium]